MQTRADLELRYDGPIPRQDQIDCSVPSRKVSPAEWNVLEARRRLSDAMIQVRWTGKVKREVRTGTIDRPSVTDYEPIKNHRDAVREALSLRVLRHEHIALVARENAPTPLNPPHCRPCRIALGRPDAEPIRTEHCLRCGDLYSDYSDAARVPDTQAAE